MATINLTADTFTEIVKSDGIVFVDFWAAWCGPCRSFAPVFEKASENHEDIVFAKVDTEEERQLAADHSIRSIPTLMVFRDSVLVYSQPGALRGPSSSSSFRAPAILIWTMSADRSPNARPQHTGPAERNLPYVLSNHLLNLWQADLDWLRRTY